MFCSALAGLLLSLTPLSNALLGWRGAGGLGAAQMYVNPVIVSAEKLVRELPPPENRLLLHDADEK